MCGTNKWLNFQTFILSFNSTIACRRSGWSDGWFIYSLYSSSLLLKKRREHVLSHVSSHLASHLYPEQLWLGSLRNQIEGIYIKLKVIMWTQVLSNKPGLNVMNEQMLQDTQG